MTINLADLRTAFTDYLANSVVSTVSAPTPDVPNTWNPGEEASFSITVKNDPEPTGIRVVNLRHHVKIEPTSVAKLKVPTSPPARANADETSPTLAPGTLVDEYFLYPVNSSLEVGDTDTISGLKAKALTIGDVTITDHVHCEASQKHLFPTDKTNTPGEREATVQ
jgi:hypothetical protein